MGLKLYLLRHGQTSFSRENAFCGSGLNPELTEDGAAMAEAFAASYQKMAWQGVYASPLIRTQQTATPLCQATGLAMELRDGLREIGYGSWEGKSTQDVFREHHDDYLRWLADPGWNAPTGGETGMTIARRAGDVLSEITAKHLHGNVLVVSHKATIRIMLCFLLGLDTGRFRARFACPVGSVSMVEFTDAGPLLHALADRAHLDERLRELPGT